jgi:FkbM family methyltransferase
MWFSCSRSVRHEFCLPVCASEFVSPDVVNQMETQPSPMAKAFVTLYVFVHGHLHLRGAGALIRFISRYLPGLQTYPYRLPGVGTIELDFRDKSACGMVNFSLGELGPNVFLFDLIRRSLVPGAVLWDVGANVGWVCAHFVRPEYDLSSLQAFEPNPVPLKPLLSLFENHPRVQVHPIGLGSREETTQLSVDSSASEIASLTRKLQGAHTVPVRIRRGDDVASELDLPLPDVVKIDVEGFEPEVVAGLRTVIARKQPIIFFEYQFLSDEEIRAMIPSGYEILLMLDDGNLTTDFAKRALGHDAVLFPANRRSLFEGAPRV